MINRRTFLAGSGALAALTIAAQSQTFTYDLLVKGGTVIDPSQSLNAIRDVAIKDGLVAAINVWIDPNLAAQVYDATGKIVTPGLIDLMVHNWRGRTTLDVDPDELMATEGTTTMVSPGDPGTANDDTFVKEIVNGGYQSRNFAWLMFSWPGYDFWPSTEVPGFNQKYINVDDLANSLIEHKDAFVGIKVRISEELIGTLDLLPVQRAVQAANIAEAATGYTFRVMVHTGRERTTSLLSQVIDALRPGDIITHCFDGTVNSSGQLTGLAQGGSVTQAAYNAKAKGVLLDVGAGGSPTSAPFSGGSMDFLTAVTCMAHLGHAAPGVYPDQLSSDAHGANWMHQTEVMSAMLALNVPHNVNYSGFASTPNLSPAITLDDVVNWATWAPAQVINRVPLLGTLQVGAPGDVAVLELQTGSFAFRDTNSGYQVTGTQKLVPRKVVKAGQLINIPSPPIDESSTGSLTSPATPSSYACTYVDRTWSLDPGASVIKLGAYLGAGTYPIKILRRNSAGNYDVVSSQSIVHPGGGWADVSIAPWTVPNDGKTYHVGVYTNNVIPQNYFSGNQRAYILSDVIGSGITLVEDGPTLVLGVRATYA